ncbi:hypothetical protein T12_11638 [Trichinella patagoniensis]|uniref:Uncharacterized protein n=1 Tax=Trichinella patagoniensis TaxID=990121 RepID=A0A0V0ZAB7_9BILA|nr:hypothetical protein T12_11638 [Trichinella patagoniensis]
MQNVNIRLHLPFHVYKHNSSGNGAQSSTTCILSQIPAGRALPLTIFCIKSIVASKTDYIVVPGLYWGFRPLSRALEFFKPLSLKKRY